MAGIQLGGLFTGIDTHTLISQLMAIERGTINRYQARQKVWSNREAALRELETRLGALRDAVQALSHAGALRAYSTTSSNPNILTAVASNHAHEGYHTVVVNQLAYPERWAHTAGQAYAENCVGAGTFIYSYNQRETVLTTTAETTLADLVGLINSDANNPGVTASLLYYNGAHHLMLSGKDAGSDYAISIHASLAGFGPADFTRTQAAQDSQIKVDGYPVGAGEWITRSSNTVDDVLPGVTLHLHEEGTVRVGLTRDLQPVHDRLNAVVSAYNAVVAFYKDKTGYDQTSKTAGVLMGDSVVSHLAHALRLSLLERASGFAAGGDSFVMPSQIGLELDKEGRLSLNAEMLNKALADDYLGVLALIAADKTGVSDSNTIRFYGASSSYTTAGTYNVEVTIAGGIVTSARIKRDTETSYRDATISGGTVLGDSTFSEKGGPAYPENGLQLRVDRTVDGTFTATVRVQQGFAGALVETLDRMVRADTGTLVLDRKHIEDQIQRLGEQITREQDRLTRKQSLLTARFARMEQALTLLQNQMAGLGLTTTRQT